MIKTLSRADMHTILHEHNWTVQGLAHYLIVQGLAHYMYSTYMYVYYWTVQGLAHYMICMLYTVNDSLRSGKNQ